MSDVQVMIVFQRKDDSRLKLIRRSSKGKSFTTGELASKDGELSYLSTKALCDLFNEEGLNINQDVEKVFLRQNQCSLAMSEPLALLRLVEESAGTKDVVDKAHRCSGELSQLSSEVRRIETSLSEINAEIKFWEPDMKNILLFVEEKRNLEEDYLQFYKNVDELLLMQDEALSIDDTDLKEIETQMLKEREAYQILVREQRELEVCRNEKASGANKVKNLVQTTDAKLMKCNKSLKDCKKQIALTKREFESVVQKVPSISNIILYFY